MKNKLHAFRLVLQKHATAFNKQLSLFFGINLGLFLISFFLLIFLALHSNAQTFPTGFSQVQIATGITNPTIMQFSPDGRIFIAQQSGALRVFKNGSLLSQPFITLSVNSSGERGLLGIAFDPAFITNHFIYLYYTVSSAANNRISRFTANGDVVVPGSEVVVLNLDPLSSATNHNGGTMQFGPDGKLYVGVGENANTAHAQNLDTYLGKILRINSDGTPATGNPFTTGTVQRRSIWSYGMRNPYTLTFQPGTGKLFVNDVGQNSWEEINDCTIGGLNYGWPAAEGNSTNPAYTNPVYTYAHGSGSGVGCAITGGTFFNPSSTNYPATYTGNYFFIDYCSNWIDKLTLSGTTWTRTSFASIIAGSPVGIITGTDGNLYFLSRTNNALYKITYTSSTAPVITTQPQSITVAQGNPASFSVTATGTPPLSYQWRKNGTNIGGAVSSTYTIASAAPADAGNYSVVVTNSAGSATSNNAALTVTSPNQVPVATINAPMAGALYTAGTSVSFTGTGNDNEDGILGAGAFEWYVMFHHDTHTHPGPSAPDGVSSGSFSIPNTGETAASVFYRLYLVVTDSQGAKDTSYTDILPRTSTITLNTNPQGLSVTLDGQPFTAPFTVTSVEGMLRTIGATSPQTINNALTYNYSSWSQGGTQTQTFATSVNNATYTANFTASLRTADNPLNSISGINYSYFHGAWSVLPDFTTLTPAASGLVLNFDISPRTQNDNFGFRHTGYISVPTNGIYTFYTSSDDGSKLYIGTAMVVNNDGLHSNLETSGQIGLLAGKHAVTVDFFEQAGSEILTVSYQGPGLAKQIVPSTSLFIATQTLDRNPVADSYVRGGSFANINYGAETKLYSKKSSADQTFESYLRFDISSLPGNISSAKLRLFSKINNASNPSVPVEILNVPVNSWQETTLTYSNKPAPVGSAIATVVISGAVFQYYELDITQQVVTLRNSGTNFISLLVRNTVTTNNSRVVFNSKESASNKPQLRIVSSTARFADAEAEDQVAFLTPPIYNIKIYPQPASDYINVELPEEFSNSELRILDLNGRLVGNFSLAENGVHFIPVNSLGNGMYLLTIENQKAIIRKKIIIEK